MSGVQEPPWIIHEDGWQFCDRRNVTLEAPATFSWRLSDSNSLLKLSSLIEEQTILLLRNHERTEGVGSSGNSEFHFIICWPFPPKFREPIPEASATSSSAWNPSLRSNSTKIVQPKSETWRSGLDALLVFLGLFVAIVTAFITPSRATLKQDEVARTNEILTNITNIILSMSGANTSSLNLPNPTVF
ncbi:hypothetical protein DFH09DRAFT_1284455 [Mycena vulgaris]|nr:hypothetical protein DFH09DRAFT_1284455 [Mycena vulgaris]